jgi:small redox-active disulfide protein 2
MKAIKVLGSGCANCKMTMKLIEAVAKEKGVEVALEKVEDMQKIVSYNIMATPGVVIDGQVVHADGVPSRGKVESWFRFFSNGPWANQDELHLSNSSSGWAPVQRGNAR